MFDVILIIFKFTFDVIYNILYFLLSLTFNVLKKFWQFLIIIGLAAFIISIFKKKGKTNEKTV